MSQQEVYKNLCRKCYIKIMKPSKKEIKKMVMSEETYQCDCCRKTDYVVEYVED
jgi:uncharacterized protein with PIN domain